MEEISLEQKLIQYGKSDYYPFHMPGHKRNMEFQENPYSMDITEIDGFDNLHEPTEILFKLQQRMAELYSAKSSYLLVNGSTCGLLTAICATTGEGERILIARNCHRAVYHGCYLRNLKVSYVFPEITQQGIQGEISFASVRKAWEEDESLRVLVITSPTYDGVVSDIKKIAELVHKRDGILIVDEAHGAHFGFHGAFPQTAVRLGADLVIQSMHKTLPSPTQTAVLHVCSHRILLTRIQKFIDIYESSSPSYLLLAGMERCIHMLESEAEHYFNKYRDNLECFYGKVQDTQKISVFYFDDPSKIIISGERAGLTGKELYDLFLRKYHLQMEMCSGSYMLAMTSFMDTEEGFHRLAEAILETESMIQASSNPRRQGIDIREFIQRTYAPRAKKLELATAWDAELEECELSQAAGRIAGNFVHLYPPGIPLLVPGEEINADFIREINTCREWNLKVQGLSGEQRIQVVK